MDWQILVQQNIIKNDTFLLTSGPIVLSLSMLYPKLPKRIWAQKKYPPVCLMSKDDNTFICCSWNAILGKQWSVLQSAERQMISFSSKLFERAKHNMYLKYPSSVTTFSNVAYQWRSPHQQNKKDPSMYRTTPKKQEL